MEVPSDIGSTASRSPDAKSGQSQPEHEQPKWTIAVDLAANIYDNKGQATGNGAFHKWQQLKSLADKTKDAPVSIVVSLPHVDVTSSSSEDLRRNLNAFNNISAARPDNTSAPNKTLIDTFVISHGQARFVESHLSKGFASDLENLLGTAGKEAPSDQLALSVFAHGYGLDLAMQGDAGAATQQEMHDAIKRGLGNRDKLDVLDLDACQMASTDTAHNMQDVARYMVASADDEIGDVAAKFDGQNIGAAVSDLIAHPDKSAAQFATDFVAQADAGLNGRPTKVPDVKNHLRTGADSLTAFDLSRYGRFEESLDKFAQALSTHLTNKADLAAIAEATDNTASYPSHLPAAVNELRDTKQFAERIIDQINAGKLPDDGSVRGAAQSLIANQTAMTLKQHNNPNIYRGVGGLTTFLPVTSQDSRHQMARLHSGMYLGLIELPEYQKQYRFKNLVSQTAAFIIGNENAVMNKGLPSAAMLPLQNALQQVQASRNQAEYARALATMGSEATKFLNSPEGQLAVDKIAGSAHPSNGDADRSMWSHLVDELVTGSMTSR